jgi:hypothetical protein
MSFVPFTPFFLPTLERRFPICGHVENRTRFEMTRRFLFIATALTVVFRTEELNLNEGSSEVPTSLQLLHRKLSTRPNQNAAGPI